MEQKMVRYLYEYRGEMPMRNIGFAKIEQDRERGKILLHMRSVGMKAGKELVLYLLFPLEGTCYGMAMGKVKCTEPEIHSRLDYTGEDLPEKVTPKQVEGIVLLGENGKRFGVSWGEGGCRVASMREYDPQWQERKRADHMPDADRNGLLQEKREEDTDTVSRESGQERKETEQAETKEGLWEGEGETESKTGEFQQWRGEGETATLRERNRSSGLEDRSSKKLPEEESKGGFQEKEAKEIQGMEKRMPDSRFAYKMLTREDLRRFPQSQWHLANNSFLLHGYRGYRHLMDIEREGIHWLGVPGLYDKREEKVARSFGFPYFHRPVKACPYDRSGIQGEFGYWCRQIKKTPL